MTDVRTTRVGEIVLHRQNDADNASRTTRVGEVVHHRLDPGPIEVRTQRIGMVVFVRQAAPGWEPIERVLMPTLS